MSENKTNESPEVELKLKRTHLALIIKMLEDSGPYKMVSPIIEAIKDQVSNEP